MKNFNDIYEQIYKQCATPMEQKRKEVQKGYISVFVIAAIVGLWWGRYFRGAPGGRFFAFCFVVIPAVTLYTLFSKKNKNYNQFFKDNVIKTFVKEYSETLEYVPNKGIEQHIYQEGEFERYDRYYSEDLIQGMLEDQYKVTMAEVHTQDVSRDSEGNTTTTTLFRGLVAVIDFAKLVKANIKIRKNKRKILDKNTRIEMDSGEFEEKFDVYTTDKIIAMQILTADVMQMILDFQAKTGLRPELTLAGNSLIIRFATGDLFEAKVFEDSLDYKTLKKYYDTINFTLDIAKNFVKNIEQTEI